MKTDIQGMALGLVSRFTGSEFSHKHNLNGPVNRVAYLLPAQALKP